MGKMKNVEIALQNYFDGEMPSLEQVDHALEHEVDESDRKYVEYIRSMVMENLRRQQEENDGSTNNSCMDETDGQFNEVDDMENDKMESVHEQERCKDNNTVSEPMIEGDEVLRENENVKKDEKDDIMIIKKVKNLDDLKNDFIVFNKMEFFQLDDNKQYYMNYEDYKKLTVYKNSNNFSLNKNNESSHTKARKPNILKLDYFKDHIKKLYKSWIENESWNTSNNCYFTFWDVSQIEDNNLNMKFCWHLLFQDESGSGTTIYSIETDISSVFDFVKFKESLDELGLTSTNIKNINIVEFYDLLIGKTYEIIFMERLDEIGFILQKK